ncbi:MAG: winged helix-turn-helix domain-containing protein [Haliea sp.]
MITFYLSDWYVDCAANRLCRGDTEVKLESRVMAVLHYLAQHPGELVTRESLEQAVWGNTVVGYDALTGCIAKLRKVLGDDPRTPRYIETISKKGYRLIGEISGAARDERAPSVQAVPKRTSRRATLATVAAIGLLLLAAFWLLADRDIATATPPDRPSIAVLPFANIGGGTEQDYFSEGITADLTTALSKLSGLLVIAHASADNWRGSPADIRQVADALGARYILDGSIRRSEDRLRITVNLVDATNEFVLWSEKYDRKQDDIFAVQDDITASIVNTLAIRFTEEEKRRTALRYTRSIDAYDDFLRGRSLYNHHTRDDNLLAREAYQRAVDRDSHFARAFSSMAMTYVVEHRYGWPSPAPDPLDTALALAKKGVALNPELPQAHWVLAHVQLFRKSYREGAEAAQRAIELEPNFADSYITLAVCKMHFGAAQEAMQLVRKGMLLNPKYPAAYASVRGQLHFFLGEHEQALLALREAIRLNANLPTPRAFLIVVLRELDRLDEADWEAEQLKILAPKFTADSVAGMFPLSEAGIIRKMQDQLRQAGF